MTRSRTIGAILAAGLVSFTACSDGPTSAVRPTSPRFNGSAVSVTASGPSGVYPSTQGECLGGTDSCYVYVTYTASPSGGSAPYTYAWDVEYANGQTHRTQTASYLWQYQFAIWNYNAPLVKLRVTAYSADGSPATSAWVYTNVY